MSERHMREVRKAKFFVLSLLLLILVCGVMVKLSPGQGDGGRQPLQSPAECYQCHARQFRENLLSVKGGYRNVSPTFNGLELAGNFLVQNALEGPMPVRTNLRPIYPDTPFVIASKPLTAEGGLNYAAQGVEFGTGDGGNVGANQLRAGFCFGCHATVRLIDGSQVADREVPAWNGVTDADGFIVADPNHPNRLAIDNSTSIRPLRDYHFVDAQGRQILPETPGMMPRGRAGVDFFPSLGASGVTCDQCHTVTGPDIARSLQRDGYANSSLLFLSNRTKTGPFLPPIANPRANFHTATDRRERIDYLRSGDYCNACHDVRPPAAETVFPERDPNDLTKSHPIPQYRLENLSTEWRISPYNSTNNPFGRIVRCQDCHMSAFPYAGDRTYSVSVFTQQPINARRTGFPDPDTFPPMGPNTNYSVIQVPGIGRSANATISGLPSNQVGVVDFGPFAGSATGQARRGEPSRLGDWQVTTPEPGIRPEHGRPGAHNFPVNFAAVAPDGFPSPSTDPLMPRPVVTHYFTGVDVPILDCAEMNQRLQVARFRSGIEGVSPYETPGHVCNERDIIDDPAFDTHTLGDGRTIQIPRSMEKRRQDLMDAAVRVTLRETDPEAHLGQKFHVKVTAAAFTGHRYPAGFSQERTTYINLRVVGANGVVLYQSGYQVNKPHPETGEMHPDRKPNGEENLDDEDLEHVNAIMDARRFIPESELPDPALCQRPIMARNLDGQPILGADGRQIKLCLNPNFHENQVFELGPDNGPEARTFFGEAKGLVMFRNELLRIYDPRNGAPPSTTSGPTHALRGRTLKRPHIEEVFSATRNNTVDNFRSLPPLEARTFEYEVDLPSEKELRQLGINPAELAPLRVIASVNFQHFPPLFLRFLARVTGDRANIRNNMADDRAPVRQNLNLYDEARIDRLLINNRNLVIAPGQPNPREVAMEVPIR